MLASHHRPPRRLARRDRRIGANFHLRPAFCSSRSTVAFRPDPSPSWKAYRLGLLPRAQRVRKRLHRINRKPDRSLRSGFPRLHLNSIRFPTRKARTVESKSDWRDFLGGTMDFQQLLFRPTSSLYRTPRSNLYLCGASTPPGGGVHGMAGYHALRRHLRIGMVNLQLVKLCLDRPGLRKGEPRAGSAARRVTRFAPQYSSDIGGHDSRLHPVRLISCC